MEILATLKEAIDRLEEIESYYNELPKLQSNVDSKLSDLLHYIENNNLKAFEAYRIVKEIHNQRTIRRKLTNDYELLKTYKIHETKLCNENNRKMLLAEIHKTSSRLNQPYKNRVYSEEELCNIALGRECTLGR